MSVAWGQFRPGIANADYGSPIKQMMRQTLVFHPGTIHEAHLIHFSEPILAPELSVYGGCHNFSLIWALIILSTEKLVAPPEYFALCFPLCAGGKRQIKSSLLRRTL